MMKKSLVMVSVLISLFTVGSAQATLFDIGAAQFSGTGDAYNLIWDNSSMRVWLDYSFGPSDANPYSLRQTRGTQGATLTFSLDPGVNVDWNYGGLGYLGWVIPSVGIMQDLYVNELGNTTSLSNTGPFDNLLAEKYWEASGYGTAGYFDMAEGTSGSAWYNTIFNYSLIYHSGSVTGIVEDSGTGTDPVPEPSTILLLGSGLLGFGWYGRKRKKA